MTEEDKLRVKAQRLSAALRAIAGLTYPRVPGEWDDQCAHEVYISHSELEDQCPYCMAAYARQVVLDQENN